MQLSMGQYSMHAGEPEQPVQQSVVMARILGFFLRDALPSPSDIGQCFSMISIMLRSVHQKNEDALHFNTHDMARSINLTAATILAVVIQTKTKVSAPGVSPSVAAFLQPSVATFEMFEACR